MKRITILGLLAAMTVAVEAQPKSNVLAKGDGVWMPKPEVTIDKKTKKKVCVWGDTENNSWHENIGLVSNVPVAKDFESAFPTSRMFGTNTPYIPCPWQLAEENGETVLHCYLKMPADIVENLWLASNETAILDKETGTLYRSRRTVPESVNSKVFGVSGKEGTVLDFQIIFPKLPETTRDICVYGVPNWHMRGYSMMLNSSLTAQGTFVAYDQKPQFHQPHLVSEAKDYNKDNHQSWAVYDDAHLIKPVGDGTYALWLTPEATYLAESCEMNWNREYFGRGGNTILLDQSGHQYKCKDVLGYPNDDLFWNEGLSGDYFAIFYVFEPLPLQLETATLIVPEGEPFAMWGANWEGKVQTLNVKELRQNQRLFEYHPRKVVK